jgi:micrococcal nuclease
MQKLLFSIFIIVLTLTTAGALAGSPKQTNCNKIPKGTQTLAATIKDFRDGDTVIIESEYGPMSVRFLSIDTPETHFMNQSQGEWGDKAAARLRELMQIQEEVNIELSTGFICDYYGRLLGHVFANGTHINKAMVADGLAVNYCLYPNVKYCKELGALTEKNMAEKRGMFSDPTIELPYEFRRRVGKRPESQFIGNMSTFEVFRPGHWDHVPVAERLFFSNERMVQAPYQMAE